MSSNEDICCHNPRPSQLLTHTAITHASRLTFDGPQRVKEECPSRAWAVWADKLGKGHRAEAYAVRVLRYADRKLICVATYMGSVAVWGHRPLLSWLSDRNREADRPGIAYRRQALDVMAAACHSWDRAAVALCVVRARQPALALQLLARRAEQAEEALAKLTGGDGRVATAQHRQHMGRIEVHTRNRCMLHS